MSTEEIGSPVRLGAGSFATVYVISGGLVVFKEVSHIDNTEKLRQEYDALDDIYLRCNTDSFFTIPRALAYFNPLTEEFSTTAPSPPSANSLRTARPLITPGVMACFQRSTYAMDRVHALPINARRHLARQYFPPQLSDGPALCRLYFGRDYTGAPPSRFVNTLNFPLDETRYAQLNTLFQFLPSAVDVARAMGSMLFRLHHRASVDARDVEFVLGGDGGAGFTFFLIDFNQASVLIKHLHFPDLPHLRCGHGISVQNPLTNSFRHFSRTTHTIRAPARPTLSTITSKPRTWIIVGEIMKHSPPLSLMRSKRPKRNEMPTEPEMANFFRGH